MKEEARTRGCIALAAMAALLASLALPACSGLPADTYNPDAISPSQPPRVVTSGVPSGRRIFVADEAAVEEPGRTPRFRPRDVPSRWRRSNMAIPMRPAPVLP